ncbi:MAG: hypothetical protein ACOC4G_12295 [Bacillota bacterium]
MWFVYPHKPINIILQVHINYNNFLKDYQKNYLDKIDKEAIRKQLNIPDGDYLKKNGGWQRTLYYNINRVLQHSRVRIQKLEWTTKTGDSHYISVWPNFIIKYNPVATDLIELISSNIRKDEDIFTCIKDPDCLLDCEDLLSYSTQRVNQACIEKNYSAVLNANYTRIYATGIKLPDFNWKSFRYPDVFLLVNLGVSSYGNDKRILSHLNYRFKFLR